MSADSGGQIWLGLLLAGCSTQFSDPLLKLAESAGGAPDTMRCAEQQVQEFTGSSFATAPRLIQDDFTIEAWIKSDQSLTGTAPFQGNPLVFADVATLVNDDFGASILNKKFQMATGNPDAAVKSTSDVATNRWVHVAATRTRASGVVLVFVDGVLEGEGIGNTNALSASPTLTIGGRAGRDFFVGLMAELRLWSTARTESEIIDNMHRRLAGNEAGLVGYYRFDDKTGATIRDHSPSGNDAALDSAGTWVRSDPPLCAP